MDSRSLAKKEAIIARAQGAVRDGLVQDPAAISTPVGAVLAYLRRHLFDPDLNVASLRRECRLRNHNVTTAFQMEVGSSIRTFIEKKRIEAATRLLSHPDLELWRIANAVGFVSPQTFSRAFRRQQEMTPSQYRHRLALGGGAPVPPTRSSVHSSPFR